MKNWRLLVFVFSLACMACSSSKNTFSSKKTVLTTSDKVVANALKYEGVSYKFGGTTKRGMDCSGVVYVAFLEEHIHLPRVSRNMAKEGTAIALRKVKKGDLVFFKIGKNNRRINHVGLVISHKNNNIRFIHATSSRGVIISSLDEKYWKNSFVKATTLF